MGAPTSTSNTVFSILFFTASLLTLVIVGILHWAGVEVFKPRPTPAQYTIKLEQDSILIYDGTRRIGTLEWTSDLGALLLNDRQ